MPASALIRTADQEIADWARGHMAVYKAPCVLKFVDSLPSSGSGKAVWRQVQDLE